MLKILNNMSKNGNLKAKKALNKLNKNKNH